MFLAGVLAGVPAPPAAADTPADAAESRAGFIARTVWVSYDGLPTLRVYLTAAGREVAGQIGKTAAQTGAAWSEVVALAPDADTPGMRAQFRCHWNFAELAEPGKPTWDLEPWRPDVDDSVMLLAGCNPGGAELG